MKPLLNDGRGAQARLVLGFLAVYLALQSLYNALHDPVGNFWIEYLAVAPSVALINLLDLPNAVAHSDQIVGVTQRLVVRAGCEGTETLFLLVAAIAVFPRSICAKVVAMLVGTVIVIVLNSARVAALWATLATAPDHFDTMHSIVAPLVLILFVYCFVLLWARASSQTWIH